MSHSPTAKRLTGGIVAIVVLAVCLLITTLALVYATVSVITTCSIPAKLTSTLTMDNRSSASRNFCLSRV